MPQFFQNWKKVNGCHGAYKIPTCFKTLKIMGEYKTTNKMKSRKKLMEMRNSSCPTVESINGCISQKQILTLK